MSLRERFMCWRLNVCYRHRVERSVLLHPLGAVTWCDACDHERAQRRWSDLVRLGVPK